MDIDVQTIIYIVIGIVWFVANSFGKKLRKKNAQQDNKSAKEGNTLPTEKKLLNWDEVFKQITNTAKPVKADTHRYNPVSDKKVIKEDTEYKKDKVSEEENFLCGDSFEHGKVNEIQNLESTNKEEIELYDHKYDYMRALDSKSIEQVGDNLASDLLKDFDLKKAVIYSEIINKPKWINNN